jgi:hypothetical protein
MNDPSNENKCDGSASVERPGPEEKCDDTRRRETIRGSLVRLEYSPPHHTLHPHTSPQKIAKKEKQFDDFIDYLQQHQ